MEKRKMTRAEAGRLGALKVAENIRKKYEENPKLCVFCETPIPYQKRHINKFCNQSCGAKFNNTKRRKKIKICKSCRCEYHSEHGSSMYCSNKCYQEFKKNKSIEKWKNGESISIRTIRSYLFNKYENKCTECGWSRVNPYTGNIPLEVEHIDGNSENNSEENLTLLCPCCHSLTKTYKGANRGNGRYCRRRRYANGQSY